jgi:hypothetical protein
MSTDEILGRVKISDVYRALGGRIFHGRGQAFWRKGEGWNVALSDAKGTWYDHAAGAGGGILDLIIAVRGCSRSEAYTWLADFAGVPVTPGFKHSPRADTGWAADLRYARWFAAAGEVLAESALAELPFYHEERRGLTAFLAAIRGSDATLVDQYRDWRRRDPEYVAALCKAGRGSKARIARRLARFLSKQLNINERS